MPDTQTLSLPASPVRADPSRGSLTFVGTATVVLRYAGYTILTDPDFLHKGDPVRLGYGLTSRRLTDPALELADLPPLDLVVLSHLPEGHLDRHVEQELDHTIPIVTTKDAAHRLAKRGFRDVRGLDTWGSVKVNKDSTRLRVTALPGTHLANPLASFLPPPVMGSLLEFEVPTGQVVFRIYITGGTVMHDALREIPRRHPDIDLVLLHLGGARLLGSLVTMDARQGVQLIQTVQPREVVPIHYNDYQAFKSTLEEFQREARAAGLEEKVRYLKHGDTYEFHVPPERLR